MQAFVQTVLVLSHIIIAALHGYDDRNAISLVLMVNSDLTGLQDGTAYSLQDLAFLVIL